MNKLISVLIGYLISLNYVYANINEDYQKYQQQQNNGLRTLIRIYDECSKIDGGFMPCLKKKAITFIDRIEQIDTINIGDGINLIRLSNTTPGQQFGKRMTENELESQLPRGIDDQNNQLTTMLIERITKFFNDHTLKVNFPKVTPDEFGKSLEEGRGKMKKMMGMMMMGMAMKMMGMIPVAMAGLYMMAGKALIVSKIALLLSGIMGLKKMMSGKGGGGGGGWSSGGGGGGSGWSSGGGSSGGWDRRSINDGQNLAYRGYNQNQQQELKQNTENENKPQ